MSDSIVPNLVKSEKIFMTKFTNHLVWTDFKAHRPSDEPDDFPITPTTYHSSTNYPHSTYYIFKRHFRHLYLRSNLKALACPPEIASLTELNTLDIRGLDSWDFDALGVFFRQFKNLIRLTLDECHLEHFPEWICELPLLDELTLNHNHISSLPDSFRNLKKLGVLQLIDNHFTDVPDTIRHLTNLEYLYMNQNQITKIPDWLGDLPILHELDLSDVIPDSHLTDFSLYKNPLEPFFEEFLSFQFRRDNLRRFNQFIPALIEKIRTNSPLDRFDETFPFYGKYREVLVRAITESPTATASRVEFLLNSHGTITTDSNSMLLL